MKINGHEIKVAYWPETPHLREIKISVFGKMELSMFLSKEEIIHFSKVLMKTSENMD